MKRQLTAALFLTAALSFLAASVAAQEEVTRVFCEPGDPDNNCPQNNPDCCVDDTLEVVFGSVESTNSIFTYDEFVAGMEIQTWQIGDIVSEGIQGWQLGVAHDGDALDLVDVSFGPGPAVAAQSDGVVVLASDEIQTCPAADPDCSTVSEPAFGYTQSVILHFKKPVVLDAGVRHLFTTAKYTLKRDVGLNGTLIQVVDTLGRTASPRAGIILTIGGQTRNPKVLVDGWIRGGGIGGANFIRGNANGDQRVNIADAIWIIEELFRSGPESTCHDAADANNDTLMNMVDAIYLLNYQFVMESPPPSAPFPNCGLDPEGDDDGLDCAETQGTCP